MIFNSKGEVLGECLLEACLKESNTKFEVVDPKNHYNECISADQMLRDF
jgi:hypothetical protein